MFGFKTQTELLQLLSAGASFSINGGIKTQTERLQLASAASSGGGTLTLDGLGFLTQTELLQLASAGSGHIVFAE